jgi:hypothetical protein
VQKMFGVLSSVCRLNSRKSCQRRKHFLRSKFSVRLCQLFKAVSFSSKVTNINRDSSVSIVTIPRAEAQGDAFEFLEGKELYLFYRNVQTLIFNPYCRLFPQR